MRCLSLWEKLCRSNAGVTDTIARQMGRCSDGETRVTRRQPSTSVNARGQSCRDLAISPHRHPSPHAWIQFSRHATRYVVKRKMGVACEKRLGGRLRSTQRKERRRNALAPPPPTGSDAGPRVRGRYMSSVNVTFMLGLSTGRGGPAMVCLEEKKTMRRGYCRETTFRSLDILDPSSTQRGNRVSQLPGIHATLEDRQQAWGLGAQL